MTKISYKTFPACPVTKNIKLSIEKDYCVKWIIMYTNLRHWENLASDEISPGYMNMNSCSISVDYYNALMFIYGIMF